MKHTTDQAIALISGFSFSAAYTLVYNVLGNINEMGILDLTYAGFKAAMIGLLGGIFGLFGKDIYNWLKKKLKK